jgi:hypothetical protein
MFAGWGNVQEKKIMTVNAEGQSPSNINTSSAKKRVNITKGLVIVVALISVM